MDDLRKIPRWVTFRDVIIVLCVGLAARLVWGSLYWAGSPTAGVLQADAWSHFDLARHAYLAGTWKIGDGPFYQPPLYTYCLLLLHKAAVHDPQGVAIFQSILGLLTGILTWWLARQVLPAAWAVGTAILVVTAGPPILYENSVLPTTIGVVLHLMGLVGLSVWWKSGRRHWLVAGGLASGLACITRPHFMAAAVLQGIWVVWATRQKYYGSAAACCIPHSAFRIPHSNASLSRFRGWVAGVLSVVVYGMLAAVGPAGTLYYNMTVGEDRVLISANGGVTFCMGTGPGAVGFLAPVPGLAPEIENQRTESVRLASQAVGHSLKPSEASRWWYGHGLAWIVQNPKEAALLLARKVLLVGNKRWVGVNTLYSFETSRVSLLRIFEVPCILILCLGLIAFLSLDRTASPIAVLLFTSVLTYFAVSVLFYVSGRFRTVALPALAILGLAWLRGICQRRTFRPREILGMLLAMVVVFTPAEFWLSMPRGRLDRNLHSLAWYNLGAVAERENRFRTAEEYYLHALETDSNLGIAHKNLGVLLVKSDRRSEAEPHLRAACELLPTDLEAQRNLEIFMQGGQHHLENENEQSPI